MNVSSTEEIEQLKASQYDTFTSSKHTSSYTLPEEPVVTIQPSKKWVAINLRDLWAYRDLLYFLTLRDVKVRYKQTALGALWAIIQPLFTMLIFWLFFGRLAGMPSDGLPYPLFALAGLIPWTFFANAITNSGNSLVGSANLITKVYFPRVIIPASVALSGIVDFAIAAVFIGGFMIYYGIVPNGQLFLLPVLVVLLFALTYGLGMFLAALTAQFRDVKYATPFFVQLGLFVSPVIYPPSFISEKYRFWLGLNPLTGIIDSYRAAIIPSQPVEWNLLVLSIVVTAVILVVGTMYFNKVERTLADVI